MSGHGHGRHGKGGHAHGTSGEARDRNGNPFDLQRYLARMEAPDRADWQRPDEVVAALQLRPGATVGEVGAGPGYFTLRLARAVGPQGRVWAVDVEPAILAVLQERLAGAGLANVTPVLGAAEDARLPAGACDRILLVNTFHHFPDGAAALARLARALAPGGRIVNVDFHARELPVGPPPDHKVSREDFLAVAREAGLALAAEREFLPFQYYLELSAPG